MTLSDREKDLFQTLSATTKSALSIIPALGQAIAGWDAYHRSRFDRNVTSVLGYLKQKIENLEIIFKADWLKSEEGQQFAWKLFDAAFDAQLEDKQELFINALIHGVRDQDIPQLEKLKFVDMLRHLSRAALLVLAEMHNMLVSQVRGPRRSPDPLLGFPLVDATQIAEKLSERYDPFLVVAAVNELESQGLFSRTGEWRKDGHGKFRPGGGFATEMCYTDFAARFAEFISDPNAGKLGGGK